MQAVNFDDMLDKLVAHDPRYHRDAYLFLREALDFTQKSLGRTQPEAAPPAGSPKPRKKPATHEPAHHVTGQELLEGLRQYALQQFGPMALMVLNEWGIHRCEDFGEIVFNMVDHRLLGKTDKDSRDDFKGGYDFDDAFRKPFLPANATRSKAGSQS
jgi:uncharacterized repeat protein (TIGR04138 family)